MNTTAAQNLCGIFLKIHQALSSLLSPHFCLRCGEESPFILCRSCSTLFAQYNRSTERCRICGKQLISEIDVCLNCREEPLLLHTDTVFPIHAYRSWKKELLFQWKICGNRTFSITAAALFNEVLTLKYAAIPLVPVPPRPGKIKNKGWDQIRDICSILHFMYGHTLENLLIRREKKQQKKLNREERLHQLGHLYEIRSKIRHIPKEVVLIDDVMTTGVTLENCANLLKKAGVEKVHAVTLFIAD